MLVSLPAVTAPIADPFLLPIAGSRELFVEYTGLLEGATASLDVTYSDSQVVSIDLISSVPEPGAALGMLFGALGLAQLKRRREGRG